MSKELKAALRIARPNLKTVSPLTYWVMLVMSMFNLLFGASLFIAFDTYRLSPPLLIVNDFFNFKFWGIVFMAIGIMKIYSLWKNDWDLSRHSLMVGVAVKAMWAVALVIRALTSPGTLLVALLWISLAAIQMGTYIWFMPPAIASYKQRRDDR